MEANMAKRVIVVGGTGFLGYHAIQEFVKKGWQVTALGLPPAPPADLFPATVEVVLRDVEQASDAELSSLLGGHQALVFAAGLDDRFTPSKPAYPKFYHANVAVPLRLFQVAERAGIRRAVVLGSYFAHFNRLWPGMRLAEHHPYIRSRVEQEEALTSIPGLETCVLELPYIFGKLPIPGWRPLWSPLVKYLVSSKKVFYMRGGSACISARTVGRAVIAAVENGKAGNCYPIGQANLSWVELLSRLAHAGGREIQVVILPDWLLKLGGVGLWMMHTLRGKESGLDPRRFLPLQTAQTFIDPDASYAALGMDGVPDDLDEALFATVEACRVEDN
jgi:nucleoside-diphosphate-sugar epimerase